MNWKNEGSGALINFIRWIVYIIVGTYIAVANNLEAELFIGVAVAVVLDHCSENWSECWKNN